jgi:hypothetical protein
MTSREAVPAAQSVPNQRGKSPIVGAVALGVGVTDAEGVLDGDGT